MNLVNYDLMNNVNITGSSLIVYERATRDLGLSNMQKHFLAVLLLATADAILGVIYLLLRRIDQSRLEEETGGGKKKKRRMQKYVVMSMSSRSKALQKTNSRRRRSRRTHAHISVTMTKPRRLM